MSATPTTDELRDAYRACSGWMYLDSFEAALAWPPMRIALTHVAAGLARRRAKAAAPAQPDLF